MPFHNWLSKLFPAAEFLAFPSVALTIVAGENFLLIMISRRPLKLHQAHFWYIPKHKCTTLPITALYD